MLNRLPASLGLALAAFAATTGVSNAAIDTQSEVMYVTAAVVIGFLIFMAIAYATAHSLGLDKPSRPEADEEARGIRASGYGEAHFDALHSSGHGSHGEEADAHGAPAAAHGH